MAVNNILHNMDYFFTRHLKKKQNDVKSPLGTSFEPKKSPLRVSDVYDTSEGMLSELDAGIPMESALLEEIVRIDRTTVGGN